MRSPALTLRNTSTKKTVLLVPLITLLILVASPKALVLRPAVQWHIVCIKTNSVSCISWLINPEYLESYRTNFVNKKHGQYNCGIGDLKEVQFGEDAAVEVKSVCKDVSAISYEEFKFLALEGQLKEQRVRRQARHRRGRYRGQTQSQYLAIDKGNEKDDGKAEAHSDADTSRAIVTGSSGMGQAQSQTIYDPSCDECLQKSENMNAESLRRPPGYQHFQTDQKIIPGNQDNLNQSGYGPNYNTIPSGNVDKHFQTNSPDVIPDQQSGTTKPNGNVNYNQVTTNGLPWYQPRETGGRPGDSSYTPNLNGISSDRNGLTPDMNINYDNINKPNNRRPEEHWRDNVGPNEGYPTGGQTNYIPQNVGSISENRKYPTDGDYYGHGGPPEHKNQWPGGYVPDYRQGVGETNKVGTTFPGSHFDQTVPGRFEIYGPNDTNAEMGGLTPGITGSDVRGTPQSNQLESNFDERSYGPNQNTFNPIPSNSPLGKTGFLPSQKYPMSWPFFTGSYPGPNGEVFYCCVVSANGQPAKGYIPGNVGNQWSGPYGNNGGRYPDGSLPIPNAGTNTQWPDPEKQNTGSYRGQENSPGGKSPGTEWSGPETFGGGRAVGRNVPGTQWYGPGGGSDSRIIPGGNVPRAQWPGPGPYTSGRDGDTSDRNKIPGGQWSQPGSYGGGRVDGSMPSGNVPRAQWSGPGSFDMERGHGNIPWSGPAVYDGGRGGGGTYRENIPGAQWSGPGVYGVGKDGSIPRETGPSANVGGNSNQRQGSRGNGGTTGDNVPGAQWSGPGQYGGGRSDVNIPGGASPGANQWQGPRDGSTTGGSVPSAQWSGPGQYGGGRGDVKIPGGESPGANQWQGPTDGSTTGGSIPGAQWSGPGQYGGGRGDMNIPGGASPGANQGQGPREGSTTGASIPGAQWSGPGQYGGGRGNVNIPGGASPGANQWQGPRDGSTTGGSVPGAQWSVPGQYGGGRGDVNIPGGASPGANQWQGRRDGSITGGNVPGAQWSGPGQYGGGRGDVNIPGGASPGANQWQGPRDGSTTGGSVPGAQWSGPGQYSGGKGDLNIPGGPSPGANRWQGPRDGSTTGGSIPGAQWSGPGQYGGGKDDVNSPGRASPGANVDGNSNKWQGPRGDGSTTIGGGPGAQWSGSGPYSSGGGESNMPGGNVHNGQWSGSGNYGGGREGNMPGGGISGTNYDQGLYNQPGRDNPQNVIDPNSILSSNDDSAAEATISQTSNGTVLSAIANGGNEKGRAQTKVQGTHTGSGSFSAQADISDDKKGAHSEVESGAKGSKSSAQGRGGSNLSQAAVQLGSETGSIQTNAESSGGLHSSNSQVQGSVKGGMADAQARGPGSTSSQAQIGFSPHKEGDKIHDVITSPFVGKGLASAQSSGRSGQSQSSLQGMFKYGISYNGAAQAGASLDKDAVFSNRQPFIGIDVFDESNKNINVSSEHKYQDTALNDDKKLYNKSETIYNTHTINHTHADHHKDYDTNILHSTSSPVDNRRSFDGEFKYSTEKELNTADDYYPDGGFGPEINDGNDMEQPDYQSYDEYNRDGNELTHEALHKSAKKKLEVKQTTGSNAQHIILDSLEGQDAEITQRYTEHPDESRIYQPGERVPGTGGYIIPIGFTGSVKSVASRNKTYAIGSRDSPSQAQTVALSPGTGKIKYIYPPPAKVVAPDNLKSLSNPKTVNNNGYVSVSKSVAHDLDSDNNIRKQYSHTYYTKSSSCGYFTFSCTMVSSPSGKKKVCKPKLPISPDGKPMKC